MKYEFIAGQAGAYGVKQMCAALGVGRSGYYAWRHRPASQREKMDQALAEKIHQEYEQSHQLAGEKGS